MQLDSFEVVVVGAGFFGAVIAEQAAAKARKAGQARLAELQKNPKLAESVQKTGQKVAAVCANCHGDNGNSTKPEVPNLAGQNTAYLLEQVRQFADGGVAQDRQARADAMGRIPHGRQAGPIIRPAVHILLVAAAQELDASQCAAVV